MHEHGSSHAPSTRPIRGWISTYVRLAYAGLTYVGITYVGITYVGGGLGGCAKVTPSFDSPEPGARNVAIVNAAASNDRRAIPDLIRMLESDDPATRLLAIATLERLTGERKGYDAADVPQARAEAIERWRKDYPNTPPAPLPQAAEVE
jgi:hypothetical protein